jgi:NNP family nitrate/nitrite transporter-like MFS transporter
VGISLSSHALQTEWKKYRSYEIDVDPDQDDKATEILISSFARPHMRAFHCSWWGFFIAFFIWFAISPLLPEIRDDLGLSKKEVWTSSIAGVGGTILVRFILGPLCDVYGARTLFTVVLCAAAIPTACTGFVHTSTGLVILRLFIGIAGGTFVMCQYWTSRLFSKEVVGTANALVGGWGNLGAGVTNLVMGSILFPSFKFFLDGDSEMAWRTVCIVPAVVAFVSGIVIYYISDDAPKGNYSELKANGVFPKVTTSGSFLKGVMNRNTSILFIQYACCFGVELTMNNAAALYFKDEFGQSTEVAAAIASIFGWLNLFARGLGGFLSDASCHKWGMRGRLWAQTICLIAEGALVLVFSTTNTLGGSIMALVFFSLFVQAAEGTSYGIVPYVDPVHMGSVTGIVGAGGNVGAVCFGLCFRQLSYHSAFEIMGFSILGSSVLSLFFDINGYSRLLLGGEECDVDKESGRVFDSKQLDDQEETDLIDA